MTALKSLTGKWKGVFTYEPENESDQAHTVDFILELTEIDSSISGECVDVETKDLFSDPIPVTGFRDDDFISFIKEYPFSYYKNEQGQFVVDSTRPHPGVSYSGEFNYETNTFTGTWDVVLDSTYHAQPRFCQPF